MSNGPATARAMYGLIEPLHTVLFFASEVEAAWRELGLEPRGEGYVVGRAAPLGAVCPEVVAATFYNFNPALAARTLPRAWATVPPDKALATRAAAVEQVFRRVGAPLDGVAEATELARHAVAGADLRGRPLAAGNAGVEPTGAPFADLWQALTVLREHRGDGHVALLTVAALEPVDVLVVYASWQAQVSRRFLQRSRLWDDDAWHAAENRVRDRGWIDDGGALTAAGRAWRDQLEADTDRLAARPWDALGDDAVRRLFALLHPLARAIVDGDVFPRRPPLPDRVDP
jgi:hypothetical protein